MDVFIKLFSWLAKQVWNPLKIRIANLAWKWKLCLLVTLALVITTLKYPEQVKERVVSTKYYWNAFWGETGKPVPLSKTQRRIVEREINGLCSMLKLKSEQLDDLN